MNLIHFQGLTCYHDCIISIVNDLGLDYPCAFATLWSETDFRYDPFHEIYLTRRMIANLEALGAKVETFACTSPKDADNTLSLIDDGEFAIIAMDAFYIPWNQFYHVFHGPHYFIARNSKSEKLFCIDPTYKKENENISRREIVEQTYEVSRVTLTPKNPLPIGAIHEAQEIVLTHPNTRSALLSQIRDCTNEKRDNIMLLGKYVDAMIRNRYLYRFFLESKSPAYNESRPFPNSDLFLSDDFFLKWKTVKNGLYKASVTEISKNLISQICGHFNELIDMETDMAEKIICSH